jgi:hypothetical protein
MKTKFLIFASVLCAIHGMAGAVTIKKAAPVSTQKKEFMDSGSSLLPGVINLVSSVQQITQQNKALKAECVPSSSDISFVNKMIKEWAKTGAQDATSAWNALGGEGKKCEGGQATYANTVQLAMGEFNNANICYDSFDGTEDKGTVWEDMPKAGIASYCDDGINVSGCAEKHRKTTSNIYEIFALVTFEEKDYTAEELTQRTKLNEKMEKCAPAKLKARQTEAVAGFVNQTLGSVGSKVGTANLMESVSGLVGGMGGGANGVLQSVSGIAQGLLMKE